MKLFKYILSEVGWGFEYSVILGFKQYDFGNKELRVLIEVDGDYWHGNPQMYGDGKRTLNEMQKNKKIRDEDKRKFAIKHGFVLLSFWEYDIYNNTENIIEEICTCLKKLNSKK